MHTEILFLGYSALFLAIVEAYLTINKLWKRKHERLVADSISIIGKIIGLIPAIAFAAYFMLNNDIPGFLNRLVVIAMLLIHIIIGAAWWVSGERRKGLWNLFKRAIRIEKDEVGVLAKSFFRPSGADKVLNILGEIALIDGVLDDKEKEFIQKFAAEWNMHFSFEELEVENKEFTGNKFVKLRNNMEAYLSISPPTVQVSQLADVLNMLVSVDNNVSPEEHLILQELNGLISDFISDEGSNSKYYVAIVPQSPIQEEEIPNIISDSLLTKKEIAGGVAFLTEAYYSQEYAEIICNQFRAITLFAIVVRPDNNLNTYIASAQALA